MLRSTLIAALAFFISAGSIAAQDLVLTNARVVDVRDGTVSEPSTIFVRDGSIVSIGGGGGN